MRKTQIFLFVLLLCISFISCPKIVEAQSFDENNEQSQTDNISSREEKYLQNSIPNNTLNYIEEEIDGEALLHKKRLLFASPFGLEEKYSSVDEGYITSVKNQNPYGTCWSFAAVAAAEANYALHNNGQKIDLSELQLAWFGTGNYQIKDKMNLITNDGIEYLYNDKKGQLNAGANQETAMLTLANGIGLSDETYMPYPNDHDHGTDLVIQNNDHCYHYDYMVTAVDVISMEEMDNVKKAIKQYGALAVSYCHYPNSEDISFYDYYGPEINSYYYSSSKRDSNHAVTLVGWDDNYSKDNFGWAGKPKPSSNGAWLLKNSWGDWFGDDGYFWISYEEGSLKNSEAYAYTIEKVDATKDYNLYQHDGGQYQGYLIADSNTISLANVYTAVRNEKINSVGVMTYNAQVSCTAYIYEIPEGKTPYDSERVLKWTSSPTNLENAGYHLIPVNDNINIASGKNFAVVLDLSVASGKDLYIPVDRTFKRMYADRSNYDEQKKGQCYAQEDGIVEDIVLTHGCSNRIKVLCEKSTTEIKPTYKVEHYLQNLTGDGYDILKETFTMEGTAGESATAVNKTYDGFTYDEEKSSSTKSGTIKADNSLVLKLYYKRNEYTLSFDTDDGNSIDPITARYETPITKPDNPTKGDEYVFIGWDKEIPATMPAENIIFTAQWATKQNGKYKLEVYLQGINTSQGTYQDYSLSSNFNDPITGKYVGDLVDYNGSDAPPSIEGFTYDREQTEQVGKASGIVTTQEVTDAGALVIKLYYLRNEYDLDIIKGEGIKAVHGAGTYYYQQEVSLYSELEDGYKFKDYTGDKTSTNNDFTFTMPDSNVTLTANGEYADYTITYNLDGGTNGSNPSTYKITSSDITINNPIKEGYFFDGWTSVNITDPIKKYVIRQGSFGDIELTAHWIDKTIDLSSAGFEENDVVYINGKKYTVDSLNSIEIDGDSAKELTTYEINDPSGDLHSQYPTHLHTYFLKKENGKLIAEHNEDFDDIMVYAGASIRMTGKKGIRIITSIPTEKKNRLINNEYDGYKVMEYGTIISWEDALNGLEPTLYLDTDGTFKATAGAKGRAFSRVDGINSVFSESGGITKYTNTLVESDSSPWTNEQIAKDFAMRSYIIICPKDSADVNDYIIIYGGTLKRSIAYVAFQNKDTYSPGSAAYEYIHGLIEAGTDADE